MIRAILSLCLIIGLAAPSARAQDVVIGITTTAQPFIITDPSGRLDGFNVELAKLLCQRMARRCSLEPTTFPLLLAGIEEGTFQIGIGNTLKTAERENKMLFSAPIWRSTSSFVGAAGMAVVDPSQARAQHPVCVVRKSIQETFLAEQPGPAENLMAVSTFRELFDRLTAGTCRLALLPTVSVLEFLSRNQGRGFDYIGPPLRDPRLSGTVHIVVTKGRPEVLEALDAAISTILRDGSYRPLIARYFPFDIL
ncbi:substrate-binding periplasmic protein [Magnetospirillum sulfuroxidans]|uniref:Transporter substrate-binding domain-containing protein n=1 Tax=Magnetospirillum sulfuroxidans TaxID=611300 RepID=A0ABS5I914_9PROT|nr:transporter substrate-binding domain-containing protein [Magnetospirillum sulfuroxidans]MBR9970931.1 transporter substrate-binding domain-containing protein [Magnetospirillum sulfuroxidans]